MHATGLAHGGPTLLGIDKSSQGGRDGLGVVGRKKETADAVFDQFAMPADIARGNDPLLRHCLQRFQRGDQIGKPRFFAWVGQHIDQLIIPFNLVMGDSAGKYDSLAHTRGGGLRTQCRIHRAATDQQQLCVRMMIA